MAMTTDITPVTAPAPRPSPGAILRAPLLFIVRLNLAHRQYKAFLLQDANRLTDMGITEQDRAQVTVWHFMEFPRH